MTKPKILLAEDDINLGSLLKQYLMAKKYDVELFVDGEKAYKGFMENQFDLCILDVMMPRKDGFTLSKDIRRINSNTPVIFLTAKNLKDDILKGFKLGADDYITKPFNMDELLLRIEAILRRSGKSAEDKMETNFAFGSLKFDSNKQILTTTEEQIKLTTKENELLRLLAVNANSILERNYALKLVWGDDSYFNARSMDVYITKLRKHLKADPSVKIINVHGKGYKLVTENE